MKGIPFYMLFRRECHRFFRVLGQSILTPLVTASLYLLIFGTSLSQSLEFFSLNYLEFLLPGLLMMGVINNAYLNSCSSLIIAKYYGDILDLKTSPLTSFVILNAMGLASCVRAFLVSLAVFFVGELFCLYTLGSWLVPAHPFLSLLLIVIAGYTFGVFGAAIGIVARTFETLNAMSQFILLPLIYLGGVFYPVYYLPPFWQKWVYFNPMFYYIDAIRYSFFSISEIDVRLSFCIIFLFFSLFYGVSYRLFSRASFQRV
ncbi:MAG: ABC transporter permease [Chlamydiota bacterium]